METIYLYKENKGRRGKTVTILKGFTRRPEEINEIARQIKSTFGVGGTVKNNCIEVQGDLRVQISARLQELGFKVKGP